jgi:hypothetical protein
MNKKNILLSILLTGLILISYFYEEVGKSNKEKVLVEKNSLIKNFEHIDVIKLEKLKVLKLKNKWSLENEKRSLSSSRINEVLNIFSGLMIEGKIDKREELSNYFKFNKVKASFISGGVEQTITLGDVSEITGNFYILLNDKDLYICSDQSLLDTPYKTQLDLKLRKYLRLKSTLSLIPFDLLNKRVLYNYDLTKLKKIKVDGRRNRWFELDLVKNITSPKPYKGIEPKKLLEYTVHLLNKFMIKKRMTINSKLLSDEMGVVNLFFDDEQIEMKLYASYNGVFGRYLHMSNSIEIYELETISKNVFYMNIQDFWNKTFIFNENMQEIDSFGFELSSDNKIYNSFSISDAKEKFVIKSLSENVEFTEFKINFMFNLIFNLVDFKEAKYIEENIDLQKEKSHLFLKLFNKTFSIYKNKNLITVVDHTLKIKYFFNYNSQPLGDSFFETIFTVGQK